MPSLSSQSLSGAAFSSATPQPLGTATAGTAITAAHSDHVHSAEVAETAFRVTDGTKKIALDATGITAATTRTAAMPDKDITIAGTDDITKAAVGLSSVEDYQQLRAVGTVVDGELLVTSGTGGAAMKRINGVTGLLKVVAGVAAMATQDTDYITRTITGAVTQSSTNTAAAGVDYGGFKIEPTYNQTGTAGSCDLYVNRTETALGSGAHYLMDLRVATVRAFSVDNKGKVTQTVTENVATGDEYAFLQTLTINKATSGDAYLRKAVVTPTAAPGNVYLDHITYGGAVKYSLSYTGAASFASTLQATQITAAAVQGVVSCDRLTHYLAGVNPLRLGLGDEIIIRNDTHNIGVGMAYTVAPSYTWSFEGNSARTIGMERHTTANTAGNSLAMQAGGATLLATDKAGGTLGLYPGVSTGAAECGVNIYGYAGAAVGAILTLVLNAGGSGYTATDVLTIAVGAGGTFIVDTVDGSGVVLTGHLGAAGTGYNKATAAATTYGGAGTGCKVNITHTDHEADNTASLMISVLGAKLAFYPGVTPIARAVLATGTGKTVDNVITALQNLGLVAQA